MLPFVGPSYALKTYKASAQRSVNLYLVGMETPSKAPFILQATPGLAVFADLGAPVRGGLRAAGRCFVVAGATLFEVYADGTKTSRGTLLTSAGPVDMAEGLTQLVIVDGDNGYAFTLSNNVLRRITSPAWQGSDRVGFLDGFFIFGKPGSQQFYTSAIDDATTMDELDFASAESQPDNTVSFVVSHRELWLLGERTVEVWFNAGSEFPFQRNNGASIEVGCIAPHSARRIDNGLIWLGRDENGDGVVYRAMSVQQAARISTKAVDESLKDASDLSQAVAWTYQDEGQHFYCLNAPGLSSTWVYEAQTGAWHERCDLDVYGKFAAFRVKHHVAAFGLHLVGGDDGKLYRMSRDINTHAGDARACERTSPHSATPLLDRVQFSQFVLDATTGEAPQGAAPLVELSWSNDGGATWGAPVTRPLGSVGQRGRVVPWRRLGMSRNRVWRVRFTDNAPFSIISADIA